MSRDHGRKVKRLLEVVLARARSCAGSLHHVMFVEVLSSPPITNKSPGPLLPAWLGYPFVYVFGFPATLIVWIVRPPPEDGVFVGVVLISTLLMWGCIWAEPFRRQYGWKPWRFSIRDLMIITTIVGLILGLVVWLNS
jgi:hypothetical protein